MLIAKLLSGMCVHGSVNLVENADCTCTSSSWNHEFIRNVWIMLWLSIANYFETMIVHCPLYIDLLTEPIAKFKIILTQVEEGKLQLPKIIK